ncbi:MAG: hypothetical protein GY718_06415 [Lentisphaerae bacterium]|nr:hypothetical protein [Lentisphaerota bacterium]
MFVVVILAIVVFGQGIAISLLFPLKTIEPIYVEFQHSTNSFVTVQRPGEKIKANQALISMFLRSYVWNREVVDKVTEEVRYNHVMAFSSDDVGKAFQIDYGDPGKSLYYKKGRKRKIHIINDISLGENSHQIIIEVTDINENVERNRETKTEWTAVIRYEFYDQHVVLDPRKQGSHLINPMGMQIEEYSLSKFDRG